MLEIKNYSISLRNSDKVVVDNISLKVDKAQSVGIVGESGSGKSLTALSTLRLLNEKIFKTSGEILINKKNIFELNSASLNKIRGNEISMIFQEPMLSLNPVKSLHSQINECLELSEDSLDDSDIRNALNAVGLTNISKILNSYPHMISGGQRQRFMIAMSILRKPSIMIADEPTTALDVTLQKQILDTLNSLKKDLDMSLVLISHDIELIRRYCDEIAVMKNGCIIENQKTVNLFMKPVHEYTQQLVNFKASSFRNDSISSNEEILNTDNLNCKYLTKDSFVTKRKEYFHALKDINIQIYSGESVGIVGESGSGKTTLAMSIMHLLSYEGNITICENITKKIFLMIDL